jgi:hypothetical protein
MAGDSDLGEAAAVAEGKDSESGGGVGGVGPVVKRDGVKNGNAP